ncbi:MAG TPA: SAM-dependent methyltransferase [Deltaproteobacteria bacterium]|jgi:ubiquinone/menaquinone biosynthesis C-methylase UbiE|nr:SAM-dependent methyltransferase [Deltaproteobacteria bacterium]
MLTIELDRLALKPGAKILDVGCGEGRHVQHTLRYPGVTAVGLDLGEQEVRVTSQRLDEMRSIDFEMGGAVEDPGPAASIRGSSYDLPFADGEFDCVIISEVMEHLEEDERALAEVSRVLRPGGTLAVSVPREGPEAVCWALSDEYPAPKSVGGHVRIYRDQELPQMLERNGYHIEATHYAHALHAPYWWLKCFFGLENEAAWPVRVYHRLLVWDMMEKPWLTQFTEKLLNPLIGKSVVFYAIKG